MIADQQTHVLPKRKPNSPASAALAGRAPGALAAEITERCTRVHRKTEGFFAPDMGGREAAPELSEAMEAVVAPLAGLPRAEDRAGGGSVLAGPPEASRKASRRPPTPRPRSAISTGFSQVFRGGAALLALRANPPDISISWSTSPTRAPPSRPTCRATRGSFDAVIGGGFFGPWPGHRALADELGAALAEEEDYERKLDAARVWAAGMATFRTGVHFLRGLITGEEAGWEYADLARAVLEAVWPVVVGTSRNGTGGSAWAGGAIVGHGLSGCRHARGGLGPRSHRDLSTPIGWRFPTGRDRSPRRPITPASPRLSYCHFRLPPPRAVSYEVAMRLRLLGAEGPDGDLACGLPATSRKTAWTWEHHLRSRRAAPGRRGRGAHWRDRGVPPPCHRGAARPALGARDGRPIIARRLAEAKAGAGGLEIKAGRGD